MSEELTDFEFYKSVQKTDPKMTKNQRAGGRTITSIDPYYQQEIATEKWGLYGKEWGIRDTSFSTKTFTRGDKATEVTTLNGEFFYPEGKFPYSVSDKSYYISSKGNEVIDTDIEKKLYTSFKSKCLSLLGFNTDIFLGKFEDQNYINDVSSEFTYINIQQTQEIMKLVQETKTELAAFNKAFNIKKLTEMPMSEYQKALAMLKAKVAKMKKEDASQQ